jgi:2-amino-4-hydroxy-6-hydroxymethyldihydropteridine diphosphokinase
MEKIQGVTGPIKASPIYETEPVDCEAGARPFFNAVIEFSYSAEAMQLCDELKRIEVTLGRPAAHLRNMSRPIDLDLLYFGDLVVVTDQLTLPHPRIAGRRFVLQPLADIRRDLVLPGQTRTVCELLASGPQSARVVPADARWEDR